MSEDYVLKRNGAKEFFSFDKILKRLKTLGNKELKINYTELVKKIIDRLYDEIPTSEIDELTAQQCASLITTHNDYGVLASRILISNHQKNTPYTFVEVINMLYNFKDIHGTNHPLISKSVWETTNKFSDKLENMMDYGRDFNIDFFGFKTLERAYLMRLNSKIIERPQHMWMRVSVGIHGSDLEKVKTTYDSMSMKFFTHATPTLFNAGTPRPQLSSCYLLSMKEDSIDGIYETLSDCAKISKWAGGIGLHIHNIRASGTHINGTNGTSNGIVPMLRVYNNTARYVDQGGGKRNGSFAIYLEPWHKDIYDFLEMKKTHGDEEARARDLFYALWIPDKFMERVKTGGDWTLMCPNQCPGLSDAYGEEFNSLYEKYENEGKGKTVKAQDLWFKILDSQIETGTPYMLYKDACNKKSNQKNLGTIKSSNLCTEIIEYSDKDESAVCNLASIGLSKFIKKNNYNFSNITIYTKTTCDYCKLAKSHLKDFDVIKTSNYQEINMDDDVLRQKMYKTLNEKYSININSVPQIIIDGKHIGGYEELLEFMPYTVDHEKLHSITKIITDNLNKVIDVNFYPTEKTERSNLRHRPVGIGVQGLADLFALMKIPFHSDKAIKINKEIFETIYHAALEKSNEISNERLKDMTLIKNIIDETGIEYFTESDKPHEKIKCISTDNVKNVETLDVLNKLIQDNQPIKDEIDRLNGEHMGCYSTFKGSPASEGILQFDMWGVSPSDRYDWDLLKENITKTGIRNSLLIAPMPTASTSQILGNNECFEPFTSNIYVRRTIAGEFVLVNKHLMKELLQLDLWTEEIKNQIILNKGSIQKITKIPKILRERFKIVWEIPMKHILNMAKDRAAFIDQSQSTNLWMENPTYKKLTAMHFYAHSLGLKTGLYYLRTKAKATPQQFTIDPNLKTVDEDDHEICESCSG